MCGQYDKFIAAWIQCISNKIIEIREGPPVITLQHPPTFEACTCPTKTIPYKRYTHLDFLPLGLIHNIDMWHVGLVHLNE